MTTDEAKNVLLEHRPDRPRKTADRRLQKAIDVVLAKLDLYEKLIDDSEVTVDMKLYSGCLKCSAHTHCVDAFQPHSVYCGGYGGKLENN